jgi:hypothetical protein
VGSLNYQRTIFAYHGCDRAVADSVLLGRSRLKPSQNDHDWLGAGIYFWEYGPQRALEWAAGIGKRRPQQIKQPAVIGSIIHLGVCFDLLDVRFTDQLASLYPAFEQTLQTAGQPVPQNAPAHGTDRDLVRRKLDCAMINWAVPEIEKAMGNRFQTVRGVFQEGVPAFAGSGIMRKSHIQIVVRDAACILGYFRPET